MSAPEKVSDPLDTYTRKDFDQKIDEYWKAIDKQLAIAEDKTAFVRNLRGLKTLPADVCETPLLAWQTILQMMRTIEGLTLLRDRKEKT